MARTLRWTRAAFGDLEQAAEYVAKGSPAYAATLVQRVFDTAKSLHEFAERGAIIEELGNEAIRERYIDGYRLVYSVRTDVVHLLGLIHSARDFRSAWDQKDRSI